MPVKSSGTERIFKLLHTPNKAGCSPMLVKSAGSHRHYTGTTIVPAAARESVDDNVGRRTAAQNRENHPDICHFGTQELLRSGTPRDDFRSKDPSYCRLQSMEKYNSNKPPQRFQVHYNRVVL